MVEVSGGILGVTDGLVIGGQAELVEVTGGQAEVVEVIGGHTALVEVIGGQVDVMYGSCVVVRYCVSFRPSGW